MNSVMDRYLLDALHRAAGLPCILCGGPQAYRAVFVPYDARLPRFVYPLCAACHPITEQQRAELEARFFADPDLARYVAEGGRA